MQEDPELKPVFDEIKAGGMAAMMKWMNDPGFLAKIGEKMGDVAPPIAAAAPAAPIEVNDILDAAKAGDLEAIEDYCAIGKGNEKDPEGRSALHYAVAYNRLDAVKALLDNGAQVGAIDSKGNTALHYASGYARKDCIDALIAAGADVGVANEGGQKPVDVITEEPRNPLNQDEALLAKLRGWFLCICLIWYTHDVVENCYLVMSIPSIELNQKSSCKKCDEEKGGGGHVESAASGEILSNSLIPYLIIAKVIHWA